MQTKKTVFRIPHAISVVRQLNTPNEVRHTILLFPTLEFCIGLCTRYATDGFWKDNGVDAPFFRNSEEFWTFRVQALKLMIRKTFVPLEYELEQT